jgi:hypothetical protein
MNSNPTDGKAILKFDAFDDPDSGRSAPRDCDRYMVGGASR